MKCLQVFLLLCVSLPYSYQFGNALVAKYTTCFIQGFTCYRTTSCGPEENKVRHGVCRYGEECCFQPPCTSDADCALRPNSHCNEGICRCDIGYGLDGNTCRDLRECDVFSNTFTIYEGFIAWRNAIDSFDDITLAGCQQMCIDNPNCQSADFSVGSNQCWLDGETWFALPSGDRGTNFPNYHLSQRDCNLWTSI